MLRIIATTALAFPFLSLPAQSQNRPTLEIVWPIAGSAIELGKDSEKAIGVIEETPRDRGAARLSCRGGHADTRSSWRCCCVPA
jgi:hypothetical protein